MFFRFRTVGKMVGDAGFGQVGGNTVPRAGGNVKFLFVADVVPGCQWPLKMPHV